MQVKIIEDRKNNKLNSTFYIDGNDYFYAKFDIDDSIFADIFAPNIIKIWDKKNSDYYEIRQGIGWFSKSKLFKNGKFMNYFKKRGNHYNICGRKYVDYIHNNPEHGIPDIISLTYMDKQIALIKRDVIKEYHTYKNDKDLFGKRNTKLVFNISLDLDFKNNLLDLFSIVVYNATIIYNSYTSGGAHYEYGIRVIFPEEHKEHLQWIPEDEKPE